MIVTQAQDPEEVAKFDAWMRKIQNIHYSDHRRMQRAYEGVLPLKYREG